MTILLSGYFERSSNAREDLSAPLSNSSAGRPYALVRIISKKINKINEFLRAAVSLGGVGCQRTFSGRWRRCLRLALPIKGSFSTIA
jgi:hypothetical protein